MLASAVSAAGVDFQDCWRVGVSLLRDFLGQLAISFIRQFFTPYVV